MANMDGPIVKKQRIGEGPETVSMEAVREDHIRRNIFEIAEKVVVILLFFMTITYITYYLLNYLGPESVKRRPNRNSAHSSW